MNHPHEDLARQAVKTYLAACKLQSADELREAVKTLVLMAKRLQGLADEDYVVFSRGVDQ